MQVGIVGLGLMGGSLGLALRETKIFKSIVGLDMNSLHEQQALSLGLIDEIADFETIQECDVIVLATPVSAIVQILQKLPPLRAHATLIDFGSTKEQIVRALPESLARNYVPAHPMCGTEHSGPKAAFKELYHNKLVIMFDGIDSGELQRTLAKEIFIALGMQIVHMPLAEHDHHAAYISHLPHVISFALANTILQQEDFKNILALAGGGFRGMVRLANSSARMWTDIAEQNQQNLLQSMQSFEQEMRKAEKMIRESRWDEFFEWIEQANRIHRIF